MRLALLPLQFFGAHPVTGKNPVLVRGGFDPVEELRRRIELVVEAELVQVFGKPGSAFSLSNREAARICRHPRAGAN
jgi:hypothetical protein